MATKVKVTAPKIASEGERILSLAIAAEYLWIPDPIPQYRFCPTRRWRADFGWPDFKILVEVQGGTWANGKYNRGSSYEKLCERENTAMLLGYRLFRFTTAMVEDGRAIATLLQVFREATQ